MRIVLVRHGETNENASRCYLGHYDADLNEKGRQQLQTFSAKLKTTIDFPLTSIYSSDLSRAVESARMIGREFNLTSEPVFSLRELNFGDWDCKTYEKIRSEDPERLEKWIQDPYHVSPPNGETLRQLGSRFDHWFNQLLTTREKIQTVLIVSHGGPIRWFLSKWVKGDPKEFWNVKAVGHGNGIMADHNEDTGLFTSLKEL